MVQTALVDSFPAPVTPVRAASPVVTVTVTHEIAEVEALWARLAEAGVDSPGQTPGFIRLWADAHAIPITDRYFVVAHLDGRAVALLPLHRRRRAGVRLLGWFAGAHVGCAAPLLDRPALAGLSPDELTRFWRSVFAPLRTIADIVYLRATPEDELVAGLGGALTVETLHRAEFASWAEADATQRNKSRRKHDRQQGDRLAALGQVSFTEIAGGDPAAPAVLEVMFAQRALRFAKMRVVDPFATSPAARRFYDAALDPASGVDVVLHVLRLDDEIVAVRYNIRVGTALYCLISSMSDRAEVQPGSPGKQCLLRIMQTVFDAGVTRFDMGAGLTDEKRHWCNVQIALAHHYVPLTLKGRLVAPAHRAVQRLRSRIKADKRLSGVARGIVLRLKGGE